MEELQAWNAVEHRSWGWGLRHQDKLVLFRLSSTISSLTNFPQPRYWHADVYIPSLSYRDDIFQEVLSKSGMADINDSALGVLRTPLLQPRTAVYAKHKVASKLH